jgi:hypothetical protein
MEIMNLQIVGGLLGKLNKITGATTTESRLTVKITHWLNGHG